MSSRHPPDAITTNDKDDDASTTIDYTFNANLTKKKLGCIIVIAAFAYDDTFS